MGRLLQHTPYGSLLSHFTVHDYLELVVINSIILKKGVLD